MSDKETKYYKLVEKRKKYKFKELKNPSDILDGIYDNEISINPWSLWQNNLDAKIMVIGQDWGDENYYIKNKGRDSDDNPTNLNLIELFKVLKIDIGTPNNPCKSYPLFFTNAIQGIKENGMSSKVKDSWLKESGEEFLKPLIEIIKPKVIVTLGAKTLKAINYIYPINSNKTLSSIQKINPIRVNEMNLFAFYHCGGLGLANRPLSEQKRDWTKIKEYI